MRKVASERRGALYFYDEDASITFEETIDLVSAGTIREKFDSADGPLGMGNHWVILTVDSVDIESLQKWVVEVNFPNIDRVEALVKYGNGVTKRFLIGDDVAFDKWPINYRKP